LAKLGRTRTADQAKAFIAFYARPAVFLGLARSVRPGQIKFLIDRLRDFRIV
jgi:hypothetical protein